MDTEAALTAYEDQRLRAITDSIRRCGVAVTHVSPRADACACCARLGPLAQADDSTQFAYTTGLFGIGHPELLVFGLEPGPALAVLQAMSWRVRRSRDLMPGESVSVREPRLRLLVEWLPDPGSMLLEANWFYARPREHSVPGLQLTWAGSRPGGHRPTPG